MNAEAIILQEFRENAAAICDGRDPLDDPQYYVRYMGMFERPNPDVTWGEVPGECLKDGCTRISHVTGSGFCTFHHFENQGLK